MVSRIDIVNAFNTAFDTNKVYAELDEFEKLYSLLIILIKSKTTGTNTLVDIIRLRDKTTETNQLAIDSEGKVGINNLPTDYSKSSDLTSLATALNDILTELNNKADTTDEQLVKLTTTNNFITLPIDISTSGVNTIITGTVNTVIKVHGLMLIANGDVNIQFKSNTTNLSGVMSLASKGNGFVLPITNYTYFNTISGNSLIFNLSSAVQVGGFIVYEVV